MLNLQFRLLLGVSLFGLLVFFFIIYFIFIVSFTFIPSFFILNKLSIWVGIALLWIIINVYYFILFLSWAWWLHLNDVGNTLLWLIWNLVYVHFQSQKLRVYLFNLVLKTTWGRYLSVKNSVYIILSAFDELISQLTNFIIAITDNKIELLKPSLILDYYRLLL